MIEHVFIPTHMHKYVLVGHLIFWNLWLPPSLAFTGLAFHLIMSLVYEWTHYLIHTRYRPRSKLYDRLWQNHRLHHYKNENYWLGVTMLLGDRLLGTQPSFRDVETSETCRSLGFDG